MSNDKWLDYFEQPRKDDLRNPLSLADFIEIHGIFNVNQTFGRSDLSKLLQEIDDDHEDGSSAEIDDKYSAKWDDLCKIFSQRKKSIDNWPFSFDGESISLKPNPFNFNYFVYFFMLVSSCLHYVSDGSEKQKITKDFEYISYYYLKILLGKSWTVWLFANSQKSKQEKFERLSSKLHLRLGKAFNNQANSKRDHGDGGIDIVGWQRLAKDKFDHRGHVPIIIAQCGCGQNYDQKQLEATEANLTNLIEINTPYLPFFLTPRDLKGESIERWHDETKIKKVILVDRSRMLYLFSKHRLPNCKTFNDITAFIAQRLPIGIN